MKRKKAKLADIKEGFSFWLDDYLAHLRILLKAEDDIMQRALIYPAVHHIERAIEETMEAIKDEIIRESGLDNEIKKLFNNSDTNHFWDWNKDFLEWRKQKGGVVNFKRTEPEIGKGGQDGEN